MICTLTFSNVEAGRGAVGFLRRKIPGRVTQNLKSKEGITVLNINCPVYGGSFNKRSLYTAIKSCNQDIVCSRKDIIPDIPCLKVFNDMRLMHRLCGNALLHFLKLAKIPPRALKIALFDKDASHSDLAEKLINYTNILTVITDENNFYTQEASRIVYEHGAPIVVTRSRRSLHENHIIISPEKINEPLSTNETSLIFTGQAPAFSTPGIVIDRYSFSLPAEYSELCPELLEPEELACALYGIENVYSIGEMIPKGLISSGAEYTYKELIKYLKCCIG